MKVKISFRKVDSILTTRLLGKKIRNIIEKELAKGEIIILDFTGVNIISHSFADECIGKLAQKLGIELFKKKIFFNGVSDEIFPILRYVIVKRLKQTLSE